MALTFDEGIEIFDKLKKLVYLLDEKTHGRMQIEMAESNDYVFRVKFYYNPKTAEDRNNMITIVINGTDLIIWYNYLAVDKNDLPEYFLKEIVKLYSLWETKSFTIDTKNFDVHNNEIVALAIEKTNEILDVYETGMKIREKAQKQLEINFEKFKVKED